MNQSSRKIITGVSVASGVKLTIPKKQKRGRFARMFISS